MKITNTHIYFFGKQDIYSNWHEPDSCFVDPNTGLYFFTTEQAFMWQKANFFNDGKISQLLNNERNPKITKELGRKIIGFNQKSWDCVKFGFMVYVNYLKFSQDSKLKELLCYDDNYNENNKILVEASPYDKIWGVGLDENNEKILDEKNYLGQNLLGKALMEVRKLIK